MIMNDIYVKFNLISTIFNGINNNYIVSRNHCVSYLSQKRTNSHIYLPPVEKLLFRVHLA